MTAPAAPTQWQAGAFGTLPPPGRLRMMDKLIIRNEKQYLAALTRAETLAGCAAGSAGERERQEIAEAIERYESAIAMLKGVGRKAAEEPESSVAGISGSE